MNIFLSFSLNISQIFLFLNQNICCGYSKEPSQFEHPKQTSHDNRFPTMWYVRPAKPQISLRIRAIQSEPLLVAWIFYECWATDQTSFGIFELKMRLHRLVWVYTCQNATLLEITCHGSNVKENIYNFMLKTGVITVRESQSGISVNWILNWAKKFLNHQ